MNRQDAVKLIGEKFIERVNVLGTKGKKRDDAVIEYFVGAAQACILCGNMDAATALSTFLDFGLRVRGYSALLRECEAK